MDKTAACARFLDTLDRDIQAFTLQFKAMNLAHTTPLPKPVLDSLLLPPEEELDMIVRYETHLERQFQWKLQQLMSWRKVRVEVPSAETRQR